MFNLVYKSVVVECSTGVEDLAKAILKIKNIDKEEYNDLSQNAIKGSKEFDFKVLTGKLISIINSFEKNTNKVEENIYD